MNIAVVLVRHRRLLALCGLSLLLHTLVLGWLARGARPAAPFAAVPAPIALRLEADSGTGHAPQAAAPAQPRPSAPAPKRAPSHDQSAAPGRMRPPSPAAPSDIPPPSAVPAIGAPGAALVQMPGRYQVRLPPAALLSYSLVQSRPGARAETAGSAQIVWQTNGDKYRMQTGGVPGRLASEGASGDAGIMPATASEQRPDGTRATTTFDVEGQRIAFSGTQRSYPLSEGGQDRASVLMQLAGMGLAEPDQIKDVIDIYIGTAADARIARYQVLGQETVATGIGRIASWRLVQLAAPGERRLELWLAPEHNWYPVQLRATDPDGTVTTQVLSGIGEAPALP